MQSYWNDSKALCILRQNFFKIKSVEVKGLCLQITLFFKHKITIFIYTDKIKIYSIIY